jgi:hypothetical protein
MAEKVQTEISLELIRAVRALAESEGRGEDAVIFRRGTAAANIILRSSSLKAPISAYESGSAVWAGFHSSLSA